MKCLSAFRDKKGGWLNCDKRTHFAASTVRPGWAYELRYCPECYERQLGLPCPPKVNRGDLPHFQPLDIPKPPRTVHQAEEALGCSFEAVGATAAEIAEALA